MNPGIYDLIGAIVAVLIGAIITIIRHQLNKRDEVQEAMIKDLYEKHQKDADKLVDLELKIAEKHYQKPELDQKFERLETAFNKGFDDLGKRFDRLSDALLRNDTEHPK